VVTRIIVGVDESDGAAAALRWAAREGTLRSVPVVAVLAWGWLDQHHAAPAPFDPNYDDHEARAALDAIVRGVLGEAGLRAVRRKVICDLAAPALIGAVARDDLLVVGARGLGGFRELFLGSVSQQCLHHAPCAVTVVRGDGRPPEGSTERIVVGIDGSTPAHEALTWAVDEARLRSAALTVVHSYLPPYVGNAEVAWERGDDAETAQATLDDALGAVDTAGLPVPVERRLLTGGAAPAVLSAAEGADLVVLGSRGLGGFTGLLLGSVTQQVTHHAACPVVVLRAHDAQS
jgi:nucleotide-binding universal stress UspA family protein